jgi:Xaa-Pro aminopeptidase
MSSVQPPSLDVACCRQRQQAAIDVLRGLGADRAVLTRPEHVQYLTAFRPHRLMNAAVSLDVRGECVLASPAALRGPVAADRVVRFEAQWHATLRQDQPAAVAAALGEAIGPVAARRVAVEFSAFGLHLSHALAGTNQVDWVDIEPELWRLRRFKYADELLMIGRAEACTEAMYARAREIVRPGIDEIEVFNALQAAAVHVAGEPLSDLGNDYQSNSPGGPPRPRPAQAGELFILDLGPAYRGYYADNCRTLAVGGTPTALQQQAWRRTADVLDMIEATVRPGVRCRALFDEAQRMLDDYRPQSFCHHLGHGIGLFPHEAPHLNPHWDDLFQEGDVFTAEPGLYGEDLRAGVRLEQNYRVTATGVERLIKSPLGL